MRIVEIVLTIAGMTALGTVAGVLMIVSVIAMFQAPTGEPWTRGFGQYIGGLVCGAPFGAIGGLIFGITLARAQGWETRWPAAIWIGAGMGTLAGIALCFAWSGENEYPWWMTVLLGLASGATGGLFGGIIGILRPKPRKRR